MTDSFVARREFLKRTATTLGAIGIAGMEPAVGERRSDIDPQSPRRVQ
jgi:hypothetical protein